MNLFAGHPTSLAFGVFGVSGVGKTSLIERVVKQNSDYLHVQASELIKIGLLDATLSSELLRNMDYDSIIYNQTLLTRTFESVRLSNPGRVVVLDAHSIIDASYQLIPISVSTICDLKLDRLIFMKDLPQKILSRREQDRHRARPIRTVTEISDLQIQSLNLCQEYASKLKLPLKIVSADNDFALSLALARPLSSGTV